MATFAEVPVLVFDTETTGIDTDEARIVEFGGCLATPGADDVLISSFVNPGIPIPPDAAAVHRITDAMVATAESWAYVGQRVWKRIADLDDAGGVLVAFNARYDVAVLNAETTRHGLLGQLHVDEVLDPWVFVSWHHRGWRSRTLGDACLHYGVALGDAHSASDDAAMTMALLRAMVARGVIPDDVDQAFRLQRTLRERLDAEWAKYGYWFYAERLHLASSAQPRVMIGAGKHAGKPATSVPSSYYRFMFDKLVVDGAGVTETAVELFRTYGRTR